MKNTILLLSLLVITSTNLHAQSIYDLPLRNIDDDSLSMHSLAGKKTLFIVLPLNQQDSLYQEIIAFSSQYRDSIHIVGILSIEDGYTQNIKEQVRQLYGGNGIILTEAQHVRKASGSNQSSVMQWLTDRSLNRHFNRDADEVGVKFFISETGRLFAVLGRQTGLQSPIITRIMAAQQRSN